MPLAEGTNGDLTGNAARLAMAIPELQSMKIVASISGSELDAFSNMKGSDLVRALFDKLGGSVYRDGFGEIELGKYGAKAVSTGAHHPNRLLLDVNVEKSQHIRNTPGVQFPNNIPKVDFEANIAEYLKTVKSNHSTIGVDEDTDLSFFL